MKHFLGGWVVSGSVVLGSVLAACGSDGGGGSSGSPVSLDDFCGELAETICEGVEDCCGDANRGGENCMVAEEEECRTGVLNEDDQYDMVTASNYDAVAAGREIARIKRAVGNCEIARNSNSGDLVDFSNKGSGDDCNSDSDCRDGLACVDEKCGALPASGDACERRCTDGFYCDREDLPVGGDPFAEEGPGVCTARKSAGAECDYGECARGLVCKGDTIMVCTTPGQIDDPCTDQYDCLSGYCEVESGTCQTTWCLPVADNYYYPDEDAWWIY